MKMKFAGCAILLACAAFLTGCISTLEGRTKWGVPFAKDKIESLYQRSPAQIVASAREVLKRNGAVQTDNIVADTIHGKIDTRDVWVRAEAVDKDVSKVTVQVRTRGGTADVDLAAEIDKQIALQLAASR
jgi:galactitol-specific phosphotransferase system IIB component